MTEPSSSPAEKQARILIIDDEHAIVQYIAAILDETELYETEGAYNGFDAGLKLMSFKPDLVILDIRMPGIDGVKILKKIKDMDCSIKVVMISGFYDEEVEFIELGADAFMPKPLNMDDLKKVVSELTADS